MVIKPHHYSSKARIAIIDDSISRLRSFGQKSKIALKGSSKLITWLIETIGYPLAFAYSDAVNAQRDLKFIGTKYDGIVEVTVPYRRHSLYVFPYE
jgi:hypothetical protein